MRTVRDNKSPRVKSNQPAREVLRNVKFWLWLLMLALVTLMHFSASEPLRTWLLNAPYQLTPCFLERLLFLLPVVFASLEFGAEAGWLTIGLSLCLMLLRAAIVSCQPRNAILEVGLLLAVAAVLNWMFSRLAAERRAKEETLSRLKATLPIADMISRSLTLPEVMEEALAETVRIADFDSGAMCLCGPATRTPFFGTHYGMPSDLAARLKESGWKGTHFHEVLRTGQPFVKERKPPHGLQVSGTVAGGTAIEAKVTVPLRAGKDLLGAMALYSREPRHLDSQEIALIKAVTDQVSMAIRCAQLHQHTSEQLEREKRLNQLTADITSELELERVLPQIARTAQALAGTGGAGIVLWDTESKGLVFSHLTGLPSSLEDLTVSDIEGISGQVIHSGQPLVVEDYREYAARIPAFCDAGLRSVLSVPVLSRKGVMGSLNVFSLGEKHTFTEQDVALMTSLGRLAGIAIENARLYQAQQRVIEQLHISEERYRGLFENASDAIWIEDNNGRLVEANAACAQLTGYKATDLIGMPVDRFLRGSAASGRSEISMQRQDGGQVFVELVVSPISGDGSPPGRQCMARDVTERRHQEEATRFFARQAIRAQEEERQRIARELHDSTIQILVALSNRLEALLLNPDLSLQEVAQRTAKMQQMVSSAVEEIRRFSQNLRPPALDDLGLLPSLKELASDLEREQQIAVEVQALGQVRRLNPETELSLFRIVQEALANVRRHAKASEVVVNLWFDEKRIRVTIRDDGQGANLPHRLGDLAATGQMGLASIQERAHLLGGRATIRSEPGQGTTVSVELPA